LPSASAGLAAAATSAAPGAPYPRGMQPICRWAVRGLEGAGTSIKTCRRWCCVNNTRGDHHGKNDRGGITSLKTPRVGPARRCGVCRRSPRRDGRCTIVACIARLAAAGELPPQRFGLGMDGHAEDAGPASLELVILSNEPRCACSRWALPALRCSPRPARLPPRRCGQGTHGRARGCRPGEPPPCRGSGRIVQTCTRRWPVNLLKHRPQVVLRNQHPWGSPRKKRSRGRSPH